MALCRLFQNIMQNDSTTSILGILEILVPRPETVSKSVSPYHLRYTLCWATSHSYWESRRILERSWNLFAAQSLAPSSVLSWCEGKYRCETWSIIGSLVQHHHALRGSLTRQPIVAKNLSYCNLSERASRGLSLGQLVFGWDMAIFNIKHEANWHAITQHKQNLISW